MTDPGFDLTVCETEPIHQLGLVQPHGALAVLEPDGDQWPIDSSRLRVRYWSANLPGFCGLDIDAASPPLEGRTLFDVLQACCALDLKTLIAECSSVPADGPKSAAHSVATEIGRQGKRRPVWATLHRFRGYVFLEIEPRAGAAEPPADAAATVTELEAALVPGDAPATVNAFAFCSRLAELAARWFGYERVMVYRFHPDWSGEVIAETRPLDLAPYLGLRYPASDIPPQARQLYLEVPVRVIADVGAVPVPLVPPADATSAAPVDLRACRLRSVSPYHIEYLRNMGVTASLVTSLVVEGRLWGLIACHHRAPRRVAPPLFALADHLTAVASRCLEEVLAREAAAEKRRVAGQLARLGRDFDTVDGALRQLLFGSSRLTEATHAQAGGIFVDGLSAAVGPVPPAPWVETFLRKLAARTTEPCVAVPSLAAWEPGLGDQAALASGALVAFLSRDPVAAIFCFRPELSREVLWGGDPGRPVEVDPATGRISPRRSFKVWRQAVTGQARPWEPAEFAVLEGVRTQVLAVLAKADGRPVEQLRRGLEALAARSDDLEDLRAGFMDAALEGMALTATVDDQQTARTVTTNNAFREAFELREETVIDHPLPVLLGQVGLGAEALAGLGEEPREVTAWSRTLGPRILLIHRRAMYAINTDSRQCTWTVLIFQDVTGFRRVSDSLRAERDRAALSALAKSRFLATVSHELRTPLNAIIGFSDLMRGFQGAKLLTQEQMARQAEHIHQAGQHLLSLIDDLLELSSRESGHRALKEDSFDLCDLVLETCTWIERHGAVAGIAFTHPETGPALPFRGEAKAIRQALINVLSNAFKFTEPGGAVACRLATFPDGTVQVHVQDTGIGIPADQIETAFKPFEQLHADPNRQRGGIGLGLPLARALIELHGGTVTLDSTVGQGTTVTLALPPWRRGVTP